MKSLIRIVIVVLLLNVFGNISRASDTRTASGKVTGIIIQDFSGEDITDPTLRDIEKIIRIRLDTRPDYVFEFVIYKLTYISISQRDHYRLINLIHERALDLFNDAKALGWTTTILYNFNIGTSTGRIDQAEFKK